MIFKKFKPFTAPKVFQFKDPNSGHQFTGTSIKDLVVQVEGYRKANELPAIEYLETVIENYLCHLPLHAGSCTPLQGHKRSVIQYLEGGIALLKNIAYKSFATQEQADKRSEICSKCPKNVFPDKNFFVKWSDDIAERSVGKLKSKHHDELGICDICSCPLKAKVWYKGVIKLTPVELQQMKKIPNCWQPPLVNVNAK